ncbi:MAG: hypothetical protein ACI8QC_000686 [Planctomycetota bacterium]
MCVLCGALGLSAGFCAGVFTRNTELGRYFLDWLPGDVAESRLRGDSVIGALEGFKGAHGAYPVGLYELVPDFLASIPWPRAGKGCWSYETDRAGSRYTLSFGLGANMYPVCSYTSEGRAWWEDS